MNKTHQCYEMKKFCTKTKKEYVFIDQHPANGQPGWAYMIDGWVADALNINVRCVYCKEKLPWPPRNVVTIE